MRLIEQEVVKLPELELFRNFEGQDIIKLPSHGQIIVKSKSGNTYPVNLSRKTLYNEGILQDPDHLVAVIDTDSQPWRVEQIKTRVTL